MALGRFPQRCGAASRDPTGARGGRVPNGPRAELGIFWNTCLLQGSSEGRPGGTRVNINKPLPTPGPSIPTARQPSREGVGFHRVLQWEEREGWEAGVIRWDRAGGGGRARVYGLWVHGGARSRSGGTAVCGNRKQNKPPGATMPLGVTRGNGRGGREAALFISISPGERQHRIVLALYCVIK